jgi:hypothetical protein
MACEINEGWITGALMYLIFTLPGSKFWICSKGVKHVQEMWFYWTIKKKACILFFVMKTNKMHYLFLIYFVNQPLHVLGMFIAHHKEVFTVYVQQLVCVIPLSWLAAGWIRMEEFQST